MLRAFSILAGAILLATSLAFAAAPPPAAASAGDDDDRMMRAFTQVRIGTPFSHIAALGLDPARAERLSRADLMKRFMPKDRTAFNALDPAVKNCYRGTDDCAAYIFQVYTEPTVLLVQGGRVTWKMMSNAVIAEAGSPRTAG
jgi:hypothetical protein